ncbi:MAG: gliding motility-associated C-terminal domain-containing protein [Emticicia sp.]|uniref:T9SS type B sorting domain-containing protein n=1 Tax=Emticicia sp. TaxID=1930953 RepID=UPI003BA7FC27
MKRFFLFIFFQLLVSVCFASHIVGGEIEVVPLKNPVVGTSTHQVTLSLYFDAINGRTAAEDLSITLQIYRKRDLMRMGNVTCPQVYRQPIKYIDPSCQKGDLSTLLMKYSNNINLPEADFSDPEGYMIVWERCCRNSIITNIQNPSNVGMVFYTEFPPVTTPNTTPRFRDIIADYVCINQNFEMDFSATDADGDSLAYTLVVPWIGNSSPQQSNPTNSPSNNYREASWVPGISIDNVIPGEIPLRVDAQTGVLFVKPNKLGLYVFSVMVEEFRKGKRIGRMKRDFQLKVIDCIFNSPPQVMVATQNSKKFFKDGEVITLKKGEKRCFDVLFTDPDLKQRVTLSARGVNFDTRKILLQSTVNVEITSKDTLKTSFCLEDCIVTRNNVPAEFFINISDNGCPVPQNRGYRMKIQFEENQNTKPTVTTSLLSNPVITYGDTLKFTVFGNDIDNDTLSLTGNGRNFNFGSYGFSFPSKQGLGNVNSILQFIPNCEALKQKQMLLDFVVRDQRCGVTTQTIYSVPVEVKGKQNNSPIVATTLVNNTAELILNPNAANELTFNVNAQDSDNEQLTLTGVPKGFEYKNVLMTFDNKEGRGKVSSLFTWKPTCFMLGGQDSKEFIVNFSTKDNNCLQLQDSVSVKLILKDNSVIENPIQPYNTFTPNGDGKNDFFSLGTIPEDNCKRQFKKFEIVNRWGKSVFVTNERSFIWTGENESSGDYFYALTYSDKVYKGVIHLVR